MEIIDGELSMGIIDGKLLSCSSSLKIRREGYFVAHFPLPFSAMSYPISSYFPATSDTLTSTLTAPPVPLNYPRVAPTPFPSKPPTAEMAAPPVLAPQVCAPNAHVHMQPHAPLPHAPLVAPLQSYPSHPLAQTLPRLQYSATSLSLLHALQPSHFPLSNNTITLEADNNLSHSPLASIKVFYTHDVETYDQSLKCPVVILTIQNSVLTVSYIDRIVADVHIPLTPPGAGSSGGGNAMITWSQLRETSNAARREMLERVRESKPDVLSKTLAMEKESEDNYELRQVVVKQNKQLVDINKTVARLLDKVAELEAEVSRLSVPKEEAIKAIYESPPHKQARQRREYSPTTSPCSSVDDDKEAAPHLRSTQTWDLTSPQRVHLRHKDDEYEEEFGEEVYDTPVSPPHCIAQPLEDDMSIPKIEFDADDMSIDSDDLDAELEGGDGDTLATESSAMNWGGMAMPEMADRGGGGVVERGGVEDRRGTGERGMAAMVIPDTIEKKEEKRKKAAGTKMGGKKGEKGDREMRENLAALGRRLAKEGGGIGAGNELFKGLFNS